MRLSRTFFPVKGRVIMLLYALGLNTNRHRKHAARVLSFQFDIYVFRMATKDHNRFASFPLILLRQLVSLAGVSLALVWVRFPLLSAVLPLTLWLLYLSLVNLGTIVINCGHNHTREHAHTPSHRHHHHHNNNSHSHHHTHKKQEKRAPLMTHPRQ